MRHTFVKFPNMLPVWKRIVSSSDSSPLTCVSIAEKTTENKKDKGSQAWSYSYSNNYFIVNKIKSVITDEITKMKFKSRIVCYIIHLFMISMKVLDTPLVTLHLLSSDVALVCACMFMSFHLKELLLSRMMPETCIRVKANKITKLRRNHKPENNDTWWMKPRKDESKDTCLILNISWLDSEPTCGEKIL